jgi:hypothetical protein
LSKPAKAKVKGIGAEERPFPDVSEPAAYTIKEFIKAHRFSYGKFYDLVRRGLGPKMMKVGTRRLISIEEAARWRAERTEAKP